MNLEGQEDGGAGGGGGGRRRKREGRSRGGRNSEVNEFGKDE